MNRKEKRRDLRNSLEDFWLKESKFLEQIFDRHIPFDCKNLMKFHDLVYHHCSSFVHDPSVRSQDPGKYFYEGLTLFLNSRLKAIALDMENIGDDEYLITKYVEEWEPFRKSCEILDRGCRYFNNNWVKREHFEGNSYVHEVYRMAMIQWKELVFSPIDRALVTAMTLVVNLKSKDCTNIKSLVYKVLKSIVELYANDERQEVPVHTKLKNVFTDKVVAFYKSETLSEFQRVISSYKYDGLKNFLKYAYLAMPEHEYGVHFEAILKTLIAPHLQETIAKSLGGKDYIQAILEYNSLKRQMQDHKRLLAVIDQLCQDEINKMNQKMNPISVLVIYSNELMIKKHQTDQMITDELKRIVQVVRFLNEKDKFVQQYLQVLRARQIKETSTSDGLESSMVSLLKKEFGHDLTVTLTEQLAELDRSRIFKERFENYLDGKGVKLEFDFRLKYFTNRGFDENCKLILPLELNRAVQEFTLFHNQVLKSGKIEFNYNISTGEIVCNLDRSTHILEVSTLQMAILLQFNEQKTFTINELADRLGTKIETLQPVLDFWIRISLLISSGTYVEINTNFTNKKRRLNVSKVVTKTRKIEVRDEYELKIRRIHITNAAVVRIMKKHKVLEHSQLVGYVLEELKNIFTPEIGFIKDRINDLLKKDPADFELVGASTYRYT